MKRNVAFLLAAGILLFSAGCENPLLSVLKEKVASAAGAPDIQVSRAGVAIPSGGSAYVGTCQVAPSTKVVTLTIANIGKSALKLTGSPVVVLGGADLASFSLGSLPFTTIADGQNSTFTLEFAPDLVGDKSISVSIASDDPDTPLYTFTITGKGVSAPGPDIQVQQGSTNIDLTHAWPFGSIHAGATTDVTFTIWNYGTPGSTLGLSLNPVSIDGADAPRFSIVSQPNSGNLSIPEGGSNTFTLRFSPPAGAAASYTALVHIANNDPDEGPDYSLTVTGSGLMPDIGVKQGLTDLPDGTGSYAFTPAVPADGPNEQSTVVTFSIWNIGQLPLNLSGVSISGTNAADYVLSNTTTSPVPTGGSTSFTVRFDPSTVGSKTATVTVNSDAPGAKNPYTFAVTGTASFAKKVYWAVRDAGVIMKANLNGSNPEVALGGLGWPVGLAIDQVNNYMYIAEYGPGQIRKAPLDGSSSTVIASAFSAFHVAIDATNGKIYWTGYQPATLSKSNLDGTGVQTIGVPVSVACGIAVNPSTLDLYWTDYWGGMVYRTDKSLSAGPGAPIMGGGSGTAGLALDLSNNFLYWAEWNMCMVFRMDLSSPGRQPVGGGGAPINGIAVDSADGWVYWGDINSQLWRSNLDGSNAAPIAGGGGRVDGIAFDLVP
jgi:sugar lactone lactonase YvrE